MSVNDPYPALGALQKRINEVATSLGMQLMSMEFVVSEEDNIVHFIMEVLPETLKTNEEVESDQMNAAFDGLMGDFGEFEINEDGTVEFGETEKEEEPKDPAYDKAIAKIQEQAREKARKRLEEEEE